MDSTPLYPASGYLSIMVGPMNSRKTTMLIHNFTSCIQYGVSVVALTHALDLRKNDDPNFISSGGISVPAIRCNSIVEMARNNPDVAHNSVVLIDEAQFFDDLVEGVTLLLSMHKHIYVYGLDSDFRRQKFGHILDLIPICDSFNKVTATCSMCQGFAIFTKRLTPNDQQICVGSDIYAPLCRACYNADSVPMEDVDEEDVDEEDVDEEDVDGPEKESSGISS
jgi:thymidine kinase